LSCCSFIVEPHIHLQGLVCGYFTASPIVSVSPVEPETRGKSLGELKVVVHQTPFCLFARAAALHEFQQVSANSRCDCKSYTQNFASLIQRCNFTLFTIALFIHMHLNLISAKKTVPLPRSPQKHNSTAGKQPKLKSVKGWQANRLDIHTEFIHQSLEILGLGGYDEVAHNHMC
jgi:hypothetical protein